MHLKARRQNALWKHNTQRDVRCRGLMRNNRMRRAAFGKVLRQVWSVKFGSDRRRLALPLLLLLLLLLRLPLLLPEALGRWLLHKRTAVFALAREEVIKRPCEGKREAQHFQATLMRGRTDRHSGRRTPAQIQLSLPP